MSTDLCQLPQPSVGSEEDLLFGKAADKLSALSKLDTHSVIEQALKYRECRQVIREMQRRIVEIQATQRITETAIDAGAGLTVHTVQTVDKTVGELVKEFADTPRSEVHRQLIMNFYADQIAELKEEAAQLRRGYVAAVVSFRERQRGGF